jgi:hypothetical protein
VLPHRNPLFVLAFGTGFVPGVGEKGEILCLPPCFAVKFDLKNYVHKNH